MAPGLNERVSNTRAQNELQSVVQIGCPIATLLGTLLFYDLMEVYASTRYF